MKWSWALGEQERSPDDGAAFMKLRGGFKGGAIAP